MKTIFPPPLKAKDMVQIISPAGAVAPDYLDAARALLQNRGYCVSEGEYARGSYGRFSGTAAQRSKDLQSALDNPEVKAILCSRGGYGLTQIVDGIDFTAFRAHPKWIIGYSDITVLHNSAAKFGIASLHAGMAKQMSELGGADETVEAVFSVIAGKMPEYSLHRHPLNRLGTARGRLVGGNLSTLFGLRGTSFDLDYENGILFIEDTGEKIYHIDRMLQNLRMGGIFGKISGLIVGHFTDCPEDLKMKSSLGEIIRKAVEKYDYPVCFGFPAGHENPNFPLVLGAEIKMEIAEKQSIVKSENLINFA
jgi:muramoyltetrapeptide carboxypeptidase